MKNNKKGGATVYFVLLAILVMALLGVYLKMNWRRFKAEASFGTAVFLIIAVVLLIFFLLIRHSIRKAKKEKEKEKARLEKERLEAERIAAGGKPSTLGDGKLELNDVSEAAGKAKDKIGKFLDGGE